MKSAIIWTEPVKGELVGTVIEGASKEGILAEIKAAPIDYPNLRSPEFTKTIEIVGVGKKAIDEVEEALSGLSEGTKQLSSCKYSLGLEPSEFQG